MALIGNNLLTIITDILLKGKLLKHPANPPSSQIERKGNSDIALNNYQILPPSSNHIYRRLHGEAGDQEEPTPEVQWSRKGGCLLFLRRKTPWKKNGCETVPCSLTCCDNTLKPPPRS